MQVHSSVRIIRVSAKISKVPQAPFRALSLRVAIKHKARTLYLEVDGEWSMFSWSWLCPVLGTGAVFETGTLSTVKKWERPFLINIYPARISFILMVCSHSVSMEKRNLVSPFPFPCKDIMIFLIGYGCLVSIGLNLVCKSRGEQADISQRWKSKTWIRPTCFLLLQEEMSAVQWRDPHNSHTEYWLQ